MARSTRISATSSIMRGRDPIRNSFDQANPVKLSSYQKTIVRIAAAEGAV